MWFRNLCVYRLNDTFEHSAEELAARLADFAFQPVASTEALSRGWVPPGPDGEGLVYATGSQYLVCLQEESRLLPASVIREALDERVAEREAAEYRKLGRKEKNRLKEEITLELLPRAFTRAKRLYAWIDTRNGTLVVDTATWRQAEEVTELLRAALGSLPIQPLTAASNPQPLMTEWLSRQSEPSDVELGDEAVFEDPQNEGAEVRCKRLDLHASEITAHITAGKLVRRLALTWDERMSFVLDADLSVKRLKFLDVVQEGHEDFTPESAAERFDADFAIMTLELGRLLPRLTGMFGGEPATG
ncbi:Recombination-associated protein RdgC [wastewater metagenome]|uniref:Recombination-associated protein RdgC n=2 Tax=unclassified sequences TaxID=12908 RepID=A0A5B8RET8_9ZZZZ|nr:recombination-associated protein RdgC [Arhodomonas sp. KWT]QEA06024.1 recombination-associated protein RdgC [uncultured organism]